MRTPPHRQPRVPRTAAAAIGLLVATLLVAVPAIAEISDTLSIIKEGEEPTNADIAIRLAEATAFAGDVETVVIGRDDVFVDSLASATMQDDSLLLLVPPTGPVGADVFQLLDTLAPERIVLLGGTQAISSGVEDTFVDRGFTVERRAGLSRFETAVEIASQEAPEATTAILARAFPAEGANDPTQAFADALSAGGWAADRSWVVLLSQTEVLTGSTRNYLANSAIERVEIMGGTAAIGAAVEAELLAMGLDVVRTAGGDRFETAVEVAGKRGADSAGEAARVMLVDGQADDAWAGGFASAAHSAVFDAPIVLANGEELPASTEEWLSGMGQAFAQEGGEPPPIRLTCVTLPAACDRARELLGLPSPVEVAFLPPSGSDVQRGSTVSLSVESDPDEVLTGLVDVTGPCVAEGTYALGSQGDVFVIVPGGAPLGECTVGWALALDSGAVQTESSDYTIVSPPPPPNASFTYEQAGTCSETVQFTDTSTGSITGWQWSFGDQTTSTQQSPSHTYAGSRGFGTFSVSLTVTGPGGSETTTQDVTLDCVD
ncbi:MAG TPA: cell wall-binding repeat-containing protein [Euzebya sp.]|nr:cell wall-binding repeat-containing protein [Euzebya sp.]